MAGYFEWSGVKGNKQPFYITDRDTGGLVVAGLYETWGDAQLSCTILTMPANDDLEHIHPRMPIMLTPDTAEDWLNGSTEKPTLTNHDQPNVIYYPVSKSIGNVRNDSPELIEPVS